ncbi:hypothetical protein BaRGS_00025664 [Batillaria attramentaria]|uniref:Ankyrin repeat protein n=1 Tax=Batillaria attramentaria TaxID=370345 RepID=A0ABD0K6Z2_9CAEN
MDESEGATGETENADEQGEADPYAADILKQILEAKNGEPNKFHSFWEKDEQDVDEFTEEEIQNEPSKRILWAAENNKMDIVQQLLASDPSLVHSRDGDGYSPCIEPPTMTMWRWLSYCY